MTSRFFHALVVLGAGISATACGGKSEGTSGDDAAGNGVGGGGGSAVGGTGGGGGSAAAGAGATEGGKFPEPGPTAQWECRGGSKVSTPEEPRGSSYQGCVDVLGVTAAHLFEDCAVNPTFPKSAAECTTEEIFTCRLAVTVDGTPVLVNCACEMPIGDTPLCSICFSLDDRWGAPVSCTPELRICECAYTGILR